MGAGRAAAESSRVRRSGAWIVEHIGGLRIVGVVIAGLFLVFGGNLTGWTLLIIVIVLAVYLGLLQLVAAWARKVARPEAAAAPDSKVEETAGTS
jgi:apolipoprotein N-acyltransferase